MSNPHAGSFPLPFQVKNKSLELRFSFAVLAELDDLLLKKTGLSAIRTLQSGNISHRFVLAGVYFGVLKSYELSGTKPKLTHGEVARWFDENPQSFNGVSEQLSKAIMAAMGLELDDDDDDDDGGGDAPLAPPAPEPEPVATGPEGQ